MDTERIDIDEVKRAWSDMGRSLGMRQASDNRRRDYNRMKTALDRLRDKYRVFWIASLCMMVGTFMMFYNGMIVASRLNKWLAAAYAIYFLTVFAMDNWLYRGIGTIDPVNQPVTEVVGKSVYYKKWHLRFMAVLIPMAIAVIGFTGYVFSSDMYFLNGMIVGTICGAIIGIVQFRRFMAEYGKLAE